MWPCNYVVEPRIQLWNIISFSTSSVSDPLTNHLGISGDRIPGSSQLGSIQDLLVHLVQAPRRQPPYQIHRDMWQKLRVQLCDPPRHKTRNKKFIQSTCVRRQPSTLQHTRSWVSTMMITTISEKHIFVKKRHGGVHLFQSFSSPVSLLFVCSWWTKNKKSIGWGSPFKQATLSVTSNQSLLSKVFIKSFGLQARRSCPSRGRVPCNLGSGGSALITLDQKQFIWAMKPGPCINCIQEALSFSEFQHRMRP